MGYLVELVLAALCWGVGTVATKIALGGLPAMTVLVVELLAATTLLVTVAAVRGRLRPPPGLRRIALAGLLEPGLANAALTLGLGLTSASDASMLSGTETLFVLALAVTILGQRVHRYAVLGVVVAVLGVGTLSGTAPSADAGWGAALVLGSAFAAASYSLLVASVATRTDPLALTAWQFLAGTAASLVFAAVQWGVDGGVDLSGATTAHWVVAAVAGLLGMATPFLLYNHAIAHVNVTSAAMALNLIPLFGLVTAAVVIGERLGPWQLVGGALILAGMALFALAERAVIDGPLPDHLPPPLALTIAHPDPAAVPRRGAVNPTPRLEQFLLDNPNLPTPFLVVDLDVVADRYHRLCNALPDAAAYYAIKANPDPSVLRLLISLGCDFDVASLGEVELCLELGAHPGQLSYGNTVKKSGDIAQAYALGVRTFAADCEAELDKLVEHAPGSLVLLRMATDGHGADWPLSRKFGCGPGQVEALARQAAAHGMRVGVGFHVGSQQHDVHAWDAPIAIAADLGVRLAESGIRLEALNLGGGLPSSHAAATAPVEAYGRAITDALRRHTDGGLRGVRIMAEPGRYLVGDAGVLRTEVVLVSERDSDARRWVFLDVGMFNGLAETAEEAIRYRIRCPRPHADPVPAVLAGPTCDSLDVLYERAPYPLPADLRAGDRLDVLSAGAYTTTYSSVWFNGFEPLRAYHLAASTPARAPVPAATRG